MNVIIVENLDNLTVTFYNSRSDNKSSSHSTRDYLSESILRTKRAIKSIIGNNNFTHFYTQTFSNSSYAHYVGDSVCNCGRVSFDFVKYAINSISHYFSQYKIPYILVYDVHKDNTLHIHGLVDLSAYISKGHKRWLNSQNQVLNMRFLGYSTFQSEKLPKYCNKLFLRKFGINSFVKISTKSLRTNLSHYLSKYVSKSVNAELVPQSERRYFCSNGLKRYQSIYRDSNSYVKFFYEQISQSGAEYFNKCFENSDIYVFDTSQKKLVYWFLSRAKSLGDSHLEFPLKSCSCNCTQLSFL